MLAIVIGLVALAVAGWAFLVALSARIDNAKLERTLMQMIEVMTVEDQARTAALVERTHELEAARARLEQFRRKYEETLRLYQESVTIDGPLGSKRIQ